MYSPTFVLGAFNGSTDLPLSYRLMRRLLDMTVGVAIDEIQAYPRTPTLYQARVRYHHEPFWENPWNDVLVTHAAGFGNCKDLSAWRAADLILGRDPQYPRGMDARCDFTCQVVPAGTRMPDGTVLEIDKLNFHVFVVGPNGYHDDPSARLGMLSTQAT